MAAVGRQRSGAHRLALESPAAADATSTPARRPAPGSLLIATAAFSTIPPTTTDPLRISTFHNLNFEPRQYRSSYLDGASGSFASIASVPKGACTMKH
ncbi:unnamed protein product [Euphydryas editha]|uniref:Uncharacterized protein n=1 Tax=Euphydryas editha TaxID=104508 RepID=A0AAU9TG94_EUPED|nr:unnamed protein product [Euphydryas editha]